MIFQGENGDLKNRGLKVEINHIPLGSCKPNTNSTNNMVDNFPDSSIGEGMDITIQGANGHVKHNNDNQSLKSQDSRQSLATMSSLSASKLDDTRIHPRRSAIKQISQRFAEVISNGVCSACNGYYGEFFLY